MLEVGVGRSPNPVSFVSFLWESFRIANLLSILVICVVVLLMCAFYTLFERQFLGHIQSRRGPNKVGPWGLLQPFVDGVKLFGKRWFNITKFN